MVKHIQIKLTVERCLIEYSHVRHSGFMYFDTLLRYSEVICTSGKFHKYSEKIDFIGGRT